MHEEAYFAYRATLRISGDGLDFDDISQTLRLLPTHSHRKGGQIKPRSRPYLHDMWSYTPPIPEEGPLEDHINALWSDIRHAKRYLLGLKETATVDVFCGYRSNVATAGIQVPHTCLTLFMELEIPFGLSIIIA